MDPERASPSATHSPPDVPAGQPCLGCQSCLTASRLLINLIEFFLVGLLQLRDLGHGRIQLRLQVLGNQSFSFIGKCMRRSVPGLQPPHRPAK